jgi:hypothetical protein
MRPLACKLRNQRSEDLAPAEAQGAFKHLWINS